MPFLIYDDYFCQDSMIQNHALFFSLPYGDYLVQAFDQNGSIVVSATLELKKKSTDLNSTVGNWSTQGGEDCLVINLWSQ